MRLILFDFYKEYFLFIIIWFIDVLDIFITHNDPLKHPLEYMLVNFIYINIGELLSGFLVLYTKLKMHFLKKKEIKPKNSKKDLKLIYNDLSLKKNIIILIFLVSILDFLGRNYVCFFILFYHALGLKPQYIKWLISADILARILFSRIILKFKLYKHHKISMIICSIGFLIMAIISLQSIIVENKEHFNVLRNWIYLILAIISKFFYSLEDTISKILLTNKFILPHYLMFYRSITGFIFYLIIITILFLTSITTFNNFRDLFENNNLVLFILFVFFKIISAFFKNFSIFKIIDIFTPIHVGFVNVVSCLFEIIKLITSESEVESLIFWIFYIICLIDVMLGTLIFTEIIIINAWGLNEYTKFGLLIKETLDDRSRIDTLIEDTAYLEYNKTGINDIEICFEDIIKTRKANKTVAYNYKRKI